MASFAPSFVVVDRFSEPARVVAAELNELHAMVAATPPPDQLCTYCLAPPDVEHPHACRFCGTARPCPPERPPLAMAPTSVIRA